MKRVVLLTLLALALPMAAWADSTFDFSSKAGTMSVSTSGLTLDSTLISVGSIVGSNLGTLNISLGAFTGSLSTGGTFSGGTITITGNGSNGVPNGVLFSGTFTGPVQWTKVSSTGYILSGAFSGTFNGSTVNGITSQVISLKGGVFTPQSGDTFVSVPEPSTLGLLGTGLVGIAGLVRRRLTLTP